jgi:hypothetical protein
MVLLFRSIRVSCEIGIVSQKMLARYSHVRTEARRQAVSSLSARPTAKRISASKEASYDTNNDTKQSERGKTVSEVTENMVGPCGLEPQTSTVSRWRSSQLSYGPIAIGKFSTASGCCGPRPLLSRRALSMSAHCFKPILSKQSARGANAWLRT